MTTANALVPFGYDFAIDRPVARAVPDFKSHGIDMQELADFIRKGGLDWEVEKQPLFLADGRQVENQFGMVRNTDGRVFSVVGKNYTVLHNLQAFSWFLPYLQSGLCELYRCGNFHNGEVVWIQVRIGSDMAVGKGDSVQRLITLSHSHSGRLSVSAGVTPISVVCLNTLMLSRSVKSQTSFGKIRHTASMHSRLEGAQAEIMRVNDILDKQCEKYQFLASRRADSVISDRFIRKSLGYAENEKLPTRGQNIVDRVKVLQYSGQGQDLESRRGTLWGLYNAVTEYRSWEQGRDSDQRTERNWLGESEDLETLIEMVA